MRPWWVVMLVGCGRIGFDASGEAGSDAIAPCADPVGHDEDLDAVDDACDVCPHIGNLAQADTDGDRVGDACDPNMFEPRDRIVVFDAFTSVQSAWTYFGIIPVLEPDAVRADARLGQFVMRRNMTAAEDVFMWGGRVGDGGAAQRQVTVTLGSAGPAFYYCELNSNGSPTALFNATYTLDGTNFFVPIGTDAVGPLENRDLMIALRHGTSTYRCDTDWPHDAVIIETPIPAITPAYLSLTTQGLDTRFDYFVQIHSD